MRRRPQPDDLRPQHHRLVVFVVGEVINRGFDRHGPHRSTIRQRVPALVRFQIAFAQFCGALFASSSPLRSGGGLAPRPRGEPRPPPLWPLGTIMLPPAILLLGDQRRIRGHRTRWPRPREPRIAHKSSVCQRLEKRDQVRHLRVADRLLQRRISTFRIRIMMPDRIAQRRRFAIVHVRRRQRHIPQPRRPELARRPLPSA